MKTVLSIVVLVIFIFSFSIVLTAFNKPLAGVIIKEKTITSQLFDFFKDKAQLPDVFNDKEKSHLVDVKKVLDLIFSVMLVSVLFLLVLLPLNSKALFYAGIISILLVFLFAVVPWSFSFTLMHKVFFRENWMFSPDSALKSFYPDSVFYAYSIVIFSLVLLFSLFFVFLSTKLKKQGSIFWSR
ncbi:hypothetical protein B6U93_02475 [Candidatus Woesearchaeota archaeon ex4484_78]|nr:MAG: hypothetical protein B6U93_02475 [Candidatus Woesearchaeota archaeon ex4484_78]